MRRTMGRTGLLALFGFHYGLIGMTLLIADDRYFSSSSLVWVFWFMPRWAWGVCFMLVGGFALATALHQTAHADTRTALAFSVVALLSATWAVGQLASFFTHDLVALQAPIIWALVTSVAVHVAGWTEERR